MVWIVDTTIAIYDQIENRKYGLFSVEIDSIDQWKKQSGEWIYESTLWLRRKEENQRRRRRSRL